MKRLSVFAVALLVVLSGCSALGGGGPTTTATETTPDAVPTPVETDSDPLPPPGVTTNGINASALLDAHEAALDGSSYTLSARQQTRDGGITVDARASDGTLPARVDIESPGANRTTYITADGAFERRLGSGEATYSRVSANASAVPTGSTYIREVLDDATFSHNDTIERDGQTLYSLNASMDTLQREVEGVDPVGFDAMILVTEDGLVEEISYRLTVNTESYQEDLTVHMDLQSVGSTTVERPRWVDAIVNGEAGNTTRVVRNESLGTTLTVAGPTSDVSAVALSNGSAPFYNSDIVSSARASAIVEVSLPEPVTPQSVRMQYDPAAVPNGDVDGLFVFVYHSGYQTFLPLETVVDPQNNTVQGTRIHPDTTITTDGETVHPTLEDLPDRPAFVVMHGQTYWDNFGNRDD